MKKIYTAFVSSEYEHLRHIRKEIIDKLLDYAILPICMEHFTLAANGGKEALYNLIDDSDFFILLLSDEYGSLAEDGKSWTEHEYDYAVQQKKPILAIRFPEFEELNSLPEEKLTDNQRHLLEFGKKVSFAQKTDNNPENTKNIISKFVDRYKPDASGWLKNEDYETCPEKLNEWKKAHNALDISGLWYHVHLNDEDHNYIRTGTVRIVQDFNPCNYKDIHIEGQNYNVDHYNEAEKTIYENKMKSSKFNGDYILNDNGELTGIFKVRRTFTGDFNNIPVERGDKKGMHEFSIDVTPPEQTTEYFDGDFYDFAPSPKHGRIFIFRTKEARDAFVMEQRSDIIEKRNPQ